MTPYEAYAIDQERSEQQQIADELMYLDGAEDAALAQLPRYVDAAYLDGYINWLKQLPTHPDGTICYGLPTLSSAHHLEEF